MIHDLEATLITAIVFATIYGVIELFVRRKERLSIIEKLGEKFDPSMIANKITLPFSSQKNSYFTLKIAFLLIGLGLGFLLGYGLDMAMQNAQQQLATFNSNAYRALVDMRDTLYIASVLFCGGISLLLAFLVERKSIKNNPNQ